MTDDEIRALVRAAIQRHLGAPAGAASGASVEPPVPPPLVHPSFARYLLVRAADDSTCMIEPEVRCNHCGYCQCHGH